MERIERLQRCAMEVFAVVRQRHRIHRYRLNRQAFLSQRQGSSGDQLIGPFGKPGDHPQGQVGVLPAQ
ncbi:hypothetical protein D3C72_2044570 [compost metagenome]